MHNEIFVQLVIRLAGLMDPPDLPDETGLDDLLGAEALMGRCLGQMRRWGRDLGTYKF